MTVTCPHPPQDPWSMFFGQLTHMILWGSPDKVRSMRMGFIIPRSCSGAGPRYIPRRS